MAIKIKVMTFNLRVRVEADKNNCFDFRKEKILRVIREEAPDLIGFQEANDMMRQWLLENLTDYYVLGHGRDAAYHGESVPIAYRKDTFSLHSFRQEWLSVTPNLPGSVLGGLDQSKFPRVYACAELLHKDADEPISFFNVHTDHSGDMARIAEATILCRELAKSPYRFVITGDFNAYPNELSINMIRSTADQLGTVDATQHIVGSFHNFYGDVKECKIDYIFTNLACDPKQSYAVPDDDSCGHYYSDHNALCSFVEI